VKAGAQVGGVLAPCVFVATPCIRFPTCVRSLDARSAARLCWLVSVVGWTLFRSVAASSGRRCLVTSSLAPDRVWSASAEVDGRFQDPAAELAG